MKMRSAVGMGAALLVCFLLMCLPALTQKISGSDELHPGVVHKLPPGGPAPRTIDGHPDLSGVWFPNSAGLDIELSDRVDPDARVQFDPKVTPEERLSLQPSALAKVQALGDALRVADVPSCEPECVPGMFLMSPPRPWPTQLVQTPGQLVQLLEFNNNFRVIPLDGRAHQTHPDPTYNGDAVGHWEGDTLVVDVIGLDQKSKGFLGKQWDFIHSDQEHVIERLSRPSMNYLVYQVTIEDPKVLTKPWTSAPRHWSLSRNNEPLQEYYCAGSVQ